MIKKEKELERKRTLAKQQEAMKKEEEK